MSRMFGDHNVAFIAPFLIVLFGLPIPALAQSCPPFTSCINEGTLTFSNQVVGTVSAGQLITFTSWGSGYISGLSGVTGDFSEGPRTTCPPTFQSGCQIEILFTPTLVGTRPGRLTLTFFGTLSDLMQFWDLTGTGVPPPLPPPFDFSLSNGGNLTVVQGQSVPNTITATLVSFGTCIVTRE